MAQIQFTSIAAKAEAWRIKRVAQAGQSWHNYQLGGATKTTAVVIAPPKIEPDGTVSAEHHTLDLVRRTCSCGDQLHLDRLQVEAWRAGVTIERVECKHFTIWALLTAFAAQIGGDLQRAGFGGIVQSATPEAKTAMQSAGYWDEWPIDKRIAEQQAEAAKAKQFKEDWL